MAGVLKIASQISTPLGLVGFVFAAFFLIIRQLVKANKIPQLTGTSSVKIIDRLFALALAAVIFAFISSVYARPKTLVYRGAVLDMEANDVIDGASVIVLGHSEFYPFTTDRYGSFSLQASSYDSSLNAVVQVTHPKYKTWSADRQISGGGAADIIHLTPKPVAAPTLTSPPTVDSKPPAPVRQPQ
jgi:hypothetical protein